MNAWIVAAVAAALAPRIESKMQQPPLPPRIGLPKIIHEPYDVRPIPGAPAHDINKESK